MNLQQITQLWATLDTRKRIVITLASVAMFAAILGLARLAASPNMSLLYSGLESGPAGEVVRALEQRGMAFEVRGGAIYVEGARRDALRMTLASEGLPTNSSQGYELLDSLSGFGTTSQMFDAAYWRAKEGELARTIISSPSISSARVHIASSGSNPFQRDIRASASVMVTPATGEIPAKHAQALRYLVASAVPGLTPEDVSVIDSNGGMIGAPDEAPANISEDRADALRLRVERLLAARVGPGNAVVEVSVDTVKTSQLIRERVIDPESRVAISTDTEERTDSAQDQAGGDVTVASNLPDGDAAGDGNSQSQTSESRERINYEVSETEREITEAPGAIKRLSVAVLVNGTSSPDAAGTLEFTPRPEEELEALRELVASAVGFDEARGDMITIKTMQFEIQPIAGTAAEPSLWASLGLDLMSIIQVAVLGFVAMVLGLFVVRPLLSRPAHDDRPASLAAPDSTALPAEAEQAIAPPIAPTDAVVKDALTPLNGEIDDSDLDPDSLPVISDWRQAPQNRALSSNMDVSEDAVSRLRNMIGERQEETIEILRNWLEGEEETV
ncbi:flagellar basal-body MS-ring/collar protein FliF [Roseovarius pelagicus]|uniref:Flagellar M-ring protein n=1 Tax=Roseovarius pelagicus TaxID=2980108 RepID=A0ABY6D814_9RHOB|nr:flagellar basal-body MS-ring/collar protein FliF [Roseovarius pelagicus]UXX82271.1 flagellar basal-body MS-ring/collar protein FliF [Roseovarius pelagicus]